MRELIRKIFEDNNFDLIKEIENIDFYNHKNYTSFYLVNYIDLTEVSKDEYLKKLNELENYYIGRENKESLKNFLHDSIKDDEDKKALDKNLSAVYVIEVDDSKKFYDYRNLIYDIEESPYFFKRYVLAYTKDQLSELKNIIFDTDIYAEIYTGEYLSQFVDDFDEYKNLMKNKGEGYYELLVRLFCKLPFLNFISSNEISINSLQNSIEEKIKLDEKLSVIHDCLIDKTNMLAKDESEEEELLKRLLECIDEMNDNFIDEKLREFLDE